jgi:hypothetical protein
MNVTFVAAVGTAAEADSAAEVVTTNHALYRLAILQSV